MKDLFRANTEIYEKFGMSAANIIKYFDSGERNSMLTALRTEADKLCIIEERMKAAEEISRVVSEAHAADADTTEDDDKSDLVKKYNEQLSQIQPDSSKNEHMKEFDRIVNALNAGGAEDNDDAEMQLTGNTINVIDPITKNRMTDPVRNTVCSHVYDRESVAGMLKMNPHTRCPVAGCKDKNPLSMKNMKSDLVTKIFLESNPV